jgi:hypothetical protein
VHRKDAERLRWWPVAAATAFCLLFKVAQHRLDVNLADEGFLWYGAQRVLAGELPLRDFQAYDPGRYWWSAAWMWLSGSDGLLALRWSNSVLAAITVGMGVWVVRGSARIAGAIPLIAAGLILSVWVGASDTFAEMLLLLGLTRLVREPTPRRFFLFGVCWGVGATIGINHGLYGAVAGLLAFLYLRGGGQPARAIGAGTLGAIVGYLPMLVLFVGADGFAWAFVDSIKLLFEAGTTNVTLPLPRLWAVFEPGSRSVLSAVPESAMGVLLLLVPAFWVYFAWRLFRDGAQTAPPAATIAGVLMSVPYAHYALSRADIGHFAASALPLVMAGLAWAVASPPRLAWLSLIAVAALSVVMTSLLQPAYHFLRGRLDATIEIDGTRFHISRAVAGRIQAARTISQVAGPRPFFAGPYLPGAYALARRRSPTWELYMLFPSTPERQRAEVERLRKLDVRHALIGTAAVDDNPRLGIRMTHPLVLAYLSEREPEVEVLPALGLVLVRPARPGS